MYSCYSKSNRVVYKSLLVHNIAIVRGGAGVALAPPEFGFSEKRTEREMETQRP